VVSRIFPAGESGSAGERGRQMEKLSRACPRPKRVKRIRDTAGVERVQCHREQQPRASAAVRIGQAAALVAPGALDGQGVEAAQGARASFVAQVVPGVPGVPAVPAVPAGFGLF
jgi:hypothetical protein